MEAYLRRLVETRPVLQKDSLCLKLEKWGIPGFPEEDMEYVLTYYHGDPKVEVGISFPVFKSEESWRIATPIEYPVGWQAEVLKVTWIDDLRQTHGKQIETLQNPKV